MNSMCCIKKVFTDFAVQSSDEISRTSSCGTLVSDISIIRDTAIFAIDKYYGIFIEILSVAADCLVPRVSRETRSATNHWWSEELDDLKAMSLNAFLLWKDAGKPRLWSNF